METRLDAEPRSLKQFNGRNATTISLGPMPGVSMQDALGALEALNKQMLPAGFSVDYSGQARAFLQTGNTLVIAFLLSLLTIYLFLVAQFESLRDPVVVRLRPILMTIAAIVMAVLPLLVASGPGSVSRYRIGLVIVTGMSIGTVFTVFILPVVYTYIAQRRQTPIPSITENTLVQASE